MNNCSVASSPIIVSEDPYKKFSDIYAAPNALLPSRTGIGDYGFTSPRTGIGVISPITPRTGIGVNNELLQQRTGIGVTAPITPRTGIGVPPRTAGSSIAFPMAHRPLRLLTLGFGQRLRFFVGFS